MDTVLTRTQQWIEKFVIGLGLCPFAGPVHERKGLRIVATAATEPESLIVAVLAELDRLTDDTAVETTVIVVPHMLADFLDYNDAAGAIEDVIAAHGLEGIIQVATFHPDYRFEGAAPDAVGNYTNRSPYPMFHLIREADVTAAIDGHPDTLLIPERNVALLEQKGIRAIRELGGLD